jgi:ABC-type lipoprotein export system ATPase subunit
MEIAGRDAASRAEFLKEVIYEPRASLSAGIVGRRAASCHHATANSPKILLADEPTGNLDSKTASIFFELMQQLHRQNNVTLVLVTHDAHLAGQAKGK